MHLGSVENIFRPLQTSQVHPQLNIRMLSMNKFLIFFGFYFLFIYFELGTGLASLIKMYEPETTQRRDSFSIYLLY